MLTKYNTIWYVCSKYTNTLKFQKLENSRLGNETRFFISGHFYEKKT